MKLAVRCALWYNKCANTVISQRELLTEFVDTQTDMTSPRLYTDDGYTGTDFDRPDFQRMLNDLRAGIINCVIVKDLSRFGRNYVGVGEYLEHVFPLLNVRFISVSDSVDSYLDPRSVNNLVVPFKNILNDEYARDISPLSAIFSTGFSPERAYSVLPKS